MQAAGNIIKDGECDTRMGKLKVGNLLHHDRVKLVVPPSKMG